MNTWKTRIQYTWIFHSGEGGQHSKRVKSNRIHCSCSNTHRLSRVYLGTSKRFFHIHLNNARTQFINERTENLLINSVDQSAHRRSVCVWIVVRNDSKISAQEQVNSRRIRKWKWKLTSWSCFLSGTLLFCKIRITFLAPATTAASIRSRWSNSSIRSSNGVSKSRPPLSPFSSAT